MWGNINAGRTQKLPVITQDVTKDSFLPLSYLFGCLGSQVQHSGPPSWHASWVVVVHGCGCPKTCGILVLWPGIKPTSPELQGRFLPTRPPFLFSQLSLNTCWKNIIILIKSQILYLLISIEPNSFCLGTLPLALSKSAVEISREKKTENVRGKNAGY